MKKFLSLILMAVVTLPMFAYEVSKDVMTETFVCDSWNSETIAPSVFSNLTAGDKIQVEVTAISSETDWPQVYIKYVDASWNWCDFADDDPHVVYLKPDYTVPYTAEFTLTENMVTNILAGKNLVLSGCGYTADKVTYIHYGEGEAPTSTVIWTGSVYLDGTNGNQDLGWGNYDWSQVNVGTTLKVTFTEDTTQSYWNLDLGVAGDSWAPLSDATNWTSLGAGQTDFSVVLTEDMLTRLSTKNGLVFTGKYITVTQIELLEVATDIKKINNTVNANRKYIENGRVVIVKDNKKYTVSGQFIK